MFAIRVYLFVRFLHDILTKIEFFQVYFLIALAFYLNVQCILLNIIAIILISGATILLSFMFV